MTDFTQQNNFRNSFDIKSLVVESAYRGVIDDSRVDNILEDIRKEREMETRQEYLQGCRESDIRALLDGAKFSDLLDRVANFASDKQIVEIADFLKDFIVENSLVDDEELAR